jgi:hypothetical protein
MSVNRIERSSGLTWLLLALAVVAGFESKARAGVARSPLAANSTRSSWSAWSRVLGDMVTGELEIGEPGASGMAASSVETPSVPKPEVSGRWRADEASPAGASSPTNSVSNPHGGLTASLGARIMLDWPDCVRRLILAEIQTRLQPFASRLFRPPRSV